MEAETNTGLLRARQHFAHAGPCLVVEGPANLGMRIDREDLREHPKCSDAVLRAPRDGFAERACIVERELVEKP